MQEVALYSVLLSSRVAPIFIVDYEDALFYKVGKEERIIYGEDRWKIFLAILKALWKDNQVLRN